MSTAMLRRLAWLVFITSSLVSVLVLAFTGFEFGIADDFARGRAYTTVDFDEVGAPISCGAYFFGLLFWLSFMALAHKRMPQGAYLKGLSPWSMAIPLLVMLLLVAVIEWLAYDYVSRWIRLSLIVVPVATIVLIGVFKFAVRRRRAD